MLIFFPIQVKPITRAKMDIYNFIGLPVIIGRTTIISIT